MLRGVAKTIAIDDSDLWRKHFSRVVRGKPALKQLRIECVIKIQQMFI